MQSYRFPSIEPAENSDTSTDSDGDGDVSAQGKGGDEYRTPSLCVEAIGSDSAAARNRSPLATTALMLHSGPLRNYSSSSTGYDANINDNDSRSRFMASSTRQQEEEGKDGSAFQPMERAVGPRCPVSFVLPTAEVRLCDSMWPLPVEGLTDLYSPGYVTRPDCTTATAATATATPPSPAAAPQGATNTHEQQQPGQSVGLLRAAGGAAAGGGGGGTLAVANCPRRRRYSAFGGGPLEDSSSSAIGSSSYLNVETNAGAVLSPTHARRLTKTAGGATGSMFLFGVGPEDAVAAGGGIILSPQAQASGSPSSMTARWQQQQQQQLLQHPRLSSLGSSATFLGAGSPMARRGSNFYRMPQDTEVDVTLEEVVTNGPVPYTAAARVNGVGRRNVSTQFLALVERTAQQFWRNKIGCLAEIIVPLVFIVLIIVLNVAFGKETIVEENNVIPKRYAFQINAKDYLTYMCYDAPGGAAPIGSLPACTGPNASRYNCTGDESGIPVKGLCFYNVFSSIAVLIANYMEAAVGPLIALPKLDSIIVHQWMAKKAQLAVDSRTRTALAALSSVGLGVSSSTRYDSITYSGALLFAPYDKVPNALIQYFQANSQLFQYVFGGIFNAVEEAEAYASDHSSNMSALNSVWGIVVVNDIEDDFDVEIRLHSKALPNMKPTVTVSYRAGHEFDGSDMYIASGYVSIQKMLYDYFLTTKQTRGAIDYSYNPAVSYPMIAAFPTIAGTRHYVISIAGPLVAFIVVLAFLYPFSQMTKRLVLEKELRIREAMLIMGLRRTSLWLCYFAIAFLQNLLTSILITTLLCATVVTRSNPFVVFLILLLFSCTLIPLVSLVSTFFSKARLAALLAPLLYFVLSMLTFAMVNASDSVVIGLSIFSPTALATLMQAVIEGEGGSGFSAADFRSNPMYMPLPYKIMLMLVGDFFIYTLLMLYLDAVVPQEWGSTRHPLFFIIEPYHALKSCCYGCCNSSKKKGAAGEEEDEDTLSDHHHHHLNGGGIGAGKDTVRFDKNIGIDPATGRRKPASIQLEKLHKEYTRGGHKFTAVNQLTWRFFPGEISVLIGPNGSGKSTTINMITGMLPPGKGDCIITGHSVNTDLDGARHEIGFCPQHNILWPDLSCRQHLEFFGKIKGLRGCDLEDTITDVLRAVDLAEKIDCTPTMLSGGQKRKLSVAIAFVGRNRIVLLDEPTSGMDVAARRHTWSLLRAMAPNCTILLTTHYMDEAAVLGDHIGIVTEGNLQCAGSSLFLRSHAGSGYTLRFDLLPITPSMGPTTPMAPPSGTIAPSPVAQLRAKWESVSASVLSYVPDAVRTLRTDTEMEFCIPLSYERRLPELLRAIEKKGNRGMGIRSYALCAPTLEDVFMNIVEAAHLEKERKAGGGSPSQQQEPQTKQRRGTLPSTGSSHPGGKSPQGSDNNHGKGKNKRNATTGDSRTSSGTTCTTSSAHTAVGLNSPEKPDDMRMLAADTSETPNSLLLRRMSRGSLRFVGGETSPMFMDPVTAPHQEHEDEDDASNKEDSSWDSGNSVHGCGGGGEAAQRLAGAGGGDGDASAFGPHVDSSARTHAVPSSFHGLPHSHASSSSLRSQGKRRWRSVTILEPSVAVNEDGRAGEVPNAVGENSHAWISSEVSQPLASQLPPADEALYEPLREAAAKMDQRLDEVWRVQPVDGVSSMWGLQMEAVLFKRFFYSLRDRRMQFFQIICPVMCILLAMLLQLVNSEFKGTIAFEAAPLFESKTTLHVSLCKTTFGDADHLSGVFPPSAHDAVLFDEKNFVYSGDLNNYLIDSWYTHDEPRYAAIQCVDPTVKAMLTKFYPESLAGQQPFLMFYNTSSKHSLPYSLSTAYQLMYYQGLAAAGVDASLIAGHAFRISVKPLPLSSSVKKSNNALASILIGIIVLIPFTFLPANPVAWVVKEREIKARHLQKLSGLPYLIYWLGNFCFDFLAYLISMILVLVVFVIFRRWEYVGRSTVGPTIVAFLLYGLCCCTGSYALSFAFSEHTTAQVVVMGVSFLTGFGCVVLVFILSMLDWTKDVSDIMRWFFRFIPTYSVGEIILNLALLEQNRLLDPALMPWSMHLTGWPDVYMAAEVPVFVAITLFWDHPNRRAVVERMKACLCCRSSKIVKCKKNKGGTNSTAKTDLAYPTTTATVVTRTNGASPQRQHEGGYLGADGRQPVTSHQQNVTPMARERQQHTAKAEARYQRDIILRRQSLILPVATGLESSDFLEAGSSAMAGCSTGNIAFQPLSVATAAAAASSYSQNRNNQNSDHNNNKDREGQTSAATPRRRSQPLLVPTLEVDDLMARRTDTGSPGAVAVPMASATKADRRLQQHPRRHCHGTRTAQAMPYMYCASHLEEGDFISRAEEDGDVEDERLAVYQDEKSPKGLHVVRFVDLRKVYPNGKVAVRSLSFGVMPGEVFGFLGTNGAGKSTALSILTQEQLPSHGRAYVCGHDVVQDSRRAMRCIGYCPQFDACYDLLTVQEHLAIYARIRGIAKKRREMLVDNLMELCNLTLYKDVLSSELSGGNRRKLSIAVALLGAPQVVCLDEPSAGMDPIARRLLWRVLERVSNKCSIVLTTHHLEEVEALADTVAIMADGGLRCIGDLPHLKHKYARNAYELCISVGGNRRRRGNDTAGESVLCAAAGQDVSTAATTGSHSPFYYQQASEACTPAQRRGHSHSITYGGADFLNSGSAILQFMSANLPSALLMENFNDERYVFSIPATRDVARAMAALQDEQLRRISVDGTLLGTPQARHASISASLRACAAGKIVRLSDVFRLLQEHKERLGITEYSVSQVSLEQVFLRIAQREDDLERKRDKRKRDKRKRELKEERQQQRQAQRRASREADWTPPQRNGQQREDAPNRDGAFTIHTDGGNVNDDAVSHDEASLHLSGGSHNNPQLSLSAAAFASIMSSSNNATGGDGAATPERRDRVLSLRQGSSFYGSIRGTPTPSPLHHQQQQPSKGTDRSFSANAMASVFGWGGRDGGGQPSGTYARYRRTKAEVRARAIREEEKRQHLSEPDRVI